jgi:hypothetical protein
MGPEHIGYLIRGGRQEAQEQGYNFFWQNGALAKQIREWMAPPGYASMDFAGIRKTRAVSRDFDSQAYKEAQDNYQLVLGTPDQVIEKLRYVRDLLGLGHMCLWAHDGHMTHDDTVRCIELLGKEVLPALPGLAHQNFGRARFRCHCVFLMRGRAGSLRGLNANDKLAEYRFGGAYRYS